jgi:predicted NUDIX family phosphoesterase
MTTALCIKKQDLFKTEIDSSLQDIFVTDTKAFLDLECSLHQRSDCETDESLLQIIPYITLYDQKTAEIFVYRRGKASGESRLEGKCSIGLGGHMEITPSEDWNLLDCIATEATRELEEEVSIVDVMLRETIRRKLIQGNFGIMYNTRTPVDRVHIAVAMFIGVDKNSLDEHEEGIITRGQWMTFEDIKKAVETNMFELEHWSTLVLSTVSDALSK